mmetsp:Transcript_19894/g.47813  ORF Transcript_19894/g.47813 Transcript_19894/m.47813 type:complete len:237 (+) Transcript_19894:1405-2115(+)
MPHLYVPLRLFCSASNTCNSSYSSCSSVFVGNAYIGSYSDDTLHTTTISNIDRLRLAASLHQQFNVSSYGHPRPHQPKHPGPPIHALPQQLPPSQLVSPSPARELYIVHEMCPERIVLRLESLALEFGMVYLLPEERKAFFFVGVDFYGHGKGNAARFKGCGNCDSDASGRRHHGPNNVAAHGRKRRKRPEVAAPNQLMVHVDEHLLIVSVARDPVGVRVPQVTFDGVFRKGREAV